MGDKKDNLLVNEQALSEDELNEVTGGFGFFDFIANLFKKTPTDKLEVKAGIGRPKSNGSNGSSLGSL